MQPVAIACRTLSESVPSAAGGLKTLREIKPLLCIPTAKRRAVYPAQPAPQPRTGAKAGAAAPSCRGKGISRQGGAFGTGCDFRVECAAVGIALRRAVSGRSPGHGTVLRHFGGNVYCLSRIPQGCKTVTMKNGRQVPLGTMVFSRVVLAILLAAVFGSLFR